MGTPDQQGNKDAGKDGKTGTFPLTLHMNDTPKNSRDGASRVIAALKEFGPITALDIAADTGLSPKHVSSTLTWLKNSKGQAHITGWRVDKMRKHCKPQALYVFGPGKDARRPGPMTRAEYNSRYNRRRRVVASVWDLAIPRDQQRCIGARP